MRNEDAGICFMVDSKIRRKRCLFMAHFPACWIVPFSVLAIRQSVIRAKMLAFRDLLSAML